MKLYIVLFLFAQETLQYRLPPESVENVKIHTVKVSKDQRRLDDCVDRYREFKYGPPSLGGSAGEPAKFKEFPHMTAIGWTLESGQVEYNCGGSLISENYILTAGHCTSRDSIPPDVVRVGDINLYADADDTFAQHINISAIIKHPDYKFTSRYNDIALLKLARPAQINYVVCPACLFSEDEIDYEKLVAAGWGDTGFGQKKSDILLKFVLAPVDLKNCNELYNGDRYLKQGLLGHQFCAFDDKMDTCTGDSGGPLGTELVSNKRLIPFVVGITSFGSACGYGTPGVYVKVASFIPWIESVVGISFNPHHCALRNLKLRKELPPFFPAIDLNRNRKFDSSAYVGSSLGNNKFDWFCSASLIAENYLLASASCFEGRKLPDIVELGNNDDQIQQIGIKQIIQHPEYNSDTLEHNVALIQLEKDVQLSFSTSPSCVWSNEILPDIKMADVLGRGPQLLHVINANLTGVADLDVIATLNETKLCASRKNEFCAGIKDYYLVPKICDIKQGAPLSRSIYNEDTTNKVFGFIFGIYSYGKDCGYGRPAVFTKLAPYIAWMESVMFNNNPAMTTKKNVKRPSPVDDRIYFID